MIIRFPKSIVETVNPRYNPYTFNPRTIMSSSSRPWSEELLAKKARLAELKRERKLREEQFASGRSPGREVCTYCQLHIRRHTDDC